MGLCTLLMVDVTRLLNQAPARETARKVSWLRLGVKVGAYKSQNYHQKCFGKSSEHHIDL